MAVAIRSVDPALGLWLIVACYTPFAPLVFSKAGAQCAPYAKWWAGDFFRNRCGIYDRPTYSVG